MPATPETDPDREGALPPDVIQLLKAHVTSATEHDLLIRYGSVDDAVGAMGYMLGVGWGGTTTYEQAMEHRQERIDLYRHLLETHRIGPDLRVELGDRAVGLEKLRLVHHRLALNTWWDPCGWTHDVNMKHEPIVAAEPAESPRVVTEVAGQGLTVPIALMPGDTLTVMCPQCNKFVPEPEYADHAQTHLQGAEQAQDESAPAPERPDTPETGESLSGPGAEYQAMVEHLVDHHVVSVDRISGGEVSLPWLRGFHDAIVYNDTDDPYGDCSYRFGEDQDSESLTTPAPSTLWNLLQLVEAEFQATVTLADVEGWDAQTRRQVRDWAAAVHLFASDNDDVVVPPLPKVLDVPHPGQVTGIRVTTDVRGQGFRLFGRQGGKINLGQHLLDANVQHHIKTFGFAVEYEGDHPGVRMLLDPTKVAIHGLDQMVAWPEVRDLLEYIAQPDGEVLGNYGCRAEHLPEGSPIEELDIVARARKILGYRVKPHYPGDGTSELVKEGE